MEIAVLDIINILTTSVAGVVGWFIGRRKQRNDFLSELQASINLLSEENKKLMAEVIELRKENAKLICNQESLKLEVEKLRNENEICRKHFELINKAFNKQNET